MTDEIKLPASLEAENKTYLIPFNEDEIADLMNYVIKNNAGVQVFIALDQKFANARDIESKKDKSEGDK